MLRQICGNFQTFNPVTRWKEVLKLVAYTALWKNPIFVYESATVTDPDHLAGLGKATLGNMICV